MELPKHFTRCSGSPGRRTVGPHLWLVSFGDLLTLLLCFFLSIITFGPLGSGPRKLPSNGLDPQVVQSKVDLRGTQTARESGTMLAIHDSGSMQIELMLTEADFKKTPFEVNREAWNRLQSEIALDSYGDGAVVVETCSSLHGSASAKARFISMSRALAIRSHLIDAGLGSSSLKLRSVGEFCSVLRGRTIDDENIVARITFTTTEAGRGGGREQTRTG